jgi:hypothetical protein
VAVFIYREVADPRPPDDHVEAVAGDGAGGCAGGREAGGDRAGEEPARRRSRDGFDRSQLYDD